MAHIVSPLPGVFYVRPGPGKDPFVKVGDRVQPGQAVGIVEIMKQFTEIQSDVAGVVVSIEAAEYAAVSPGQVLVVVDTGDEA